LKPLNEALLLYIVTDRAWLGGSTLEAQVEESICAGATCVQLREKDLPYAEFLAEAQRIQTLCRRYGVPFIVNDNVDVAIACGADGVHVGQSDLAAGETRKKIGKDKILGVSAQTVEQAISAEKNDADYIGVGAVFPTGTKPDADAVSYETLKRICQNISIPVVAIGGIHAGNLLRLAGSGIDGVAVVSAIFASPDIAKATSELLTLTRQVVGK
jgi:thiamine-phosphate pyrophosphorylase